MLSLEKYLESLDPIFENMKKFNAHWIEDNEAFYQKSPIPKGFWDYWKEFKMEIKEKGFWIRKNQNDGLWELCRITIIPNQIEEIQEEISQEENLSLNDEIKEIIQNSFLYDYQKDHAMALINALIKNNVYLDSSDTGTGKTFVSLFICKALNLIPFIICPKAVISSWKKSIEKLGITEYYIANYGLLRVGKRINYQLMQRGKYKGTYRMKKVDCEIFKVSKNKNRKAKYDPIYETIWTISQEQKAKYLFIYDEAHRLKNKSLNSQIAIALKDQDVKIGLLTATLGESPLKLFGTGKVLGFYDKPFEFYTEFVCYYGCYKGNYGWEFDKTHGKRYMKAIYDRLQEENKASRMKVAELIEKGLFPETKIICDAYEMNGKGNEINELIAEMIKKLKEYDEISEELEDLKSQSKNMSDVDEDLADMIKDLKAKKDELKSPLAIRQKYRQMIEIAKIPTFVELAKDEIDSGNSVVILMNYIDSIEQLAKELNTDCLYYGRNKYEINEANRDRFEKNESHIIIGNLASMREGIDLHDKFHERMRISLISPSDSAQDLKQALGRVHRTGGSYSVQKIIFASGTIEEMVAENMKNKIENIQVLNDGDLDYTFF